LFQRLEIWWKASITILIISRLIYVKLIPVSILKPDITFLVVHVRRDNTKMRLSPMNSNALLAQWISTVTQIPSSNANPAQQETTFKKAYLLLNSNHFLQLTTSPLIAWAVTVIWKIPIALNQMVS
jgi:hypothetical protein